MNAVTEADALNPLREICRELPQVIETRTYGHPTFQAGKKKTFVVLDDHEQKGMLCLVFKLDPAQQAKLVDHEQFFPSKFGARHGWTAMKVDRTCDWGHVRELVLDSYRRVATKKMISAL